ncbi:MAG TPA: competence/damage-inducible protein A [Ktedonobacteraceae bacterium]|jgi:nicotinamide-nucleotide amidase|nr:competence/damage-inducible protein A [Ktedonobacteraceae bacterium]
MRAEILSCGTELLLGHITDTNATYLAQSLAAQGIDLYFVSQVGDNQGRIVETLRRAWERSELIIMTGGLGPTEDDLARESISALLGETMQVDRKLEADLRAMFATRRSTMPERNIKQATLIPSAQALPNPLGTAPGWWVEKEGRIIVAMPGVPREMYRMWEKEVIPRLSKYTGGLIFTRILRVWGLGESAVEERLDPLLHNTNPTIATYAKSDAIDVRITAKAESHELAEQMVMGMEKQVRQILGHHIFGVNKDTLQAVVGRHLSERNQWLATMESMTGGLLASAMTDTPESSKNFTGGIVSYSPEVKMQMGVPREVIDKYGVVSEETARAMAHAIREYFHADYGVGITGVAGPEKQEDKPVGTVYIAIEGPEGFVTGMGPGWRASREDNKRLAVLAALNLLRLHLEGVKRGE